LSSNSNESRLTDRAGAAKYCKLTPRAYDKWVKKGLLPGPIAGTRRYDIKAIDIQLDLHSGIIGPGADKNTDDDYERWMRENGQ
jgi:hypothetical protein